MHGAKNIKKAVNVSVCHFLTHVCALMQNITSTADNGNKRVMLHTDSHFPPCHTIFIIWGSYMFWSQDGSEEFVYNGKAHRKCITLKKVKLSLCKP